MDKDRAANNQEESFLVDCLEYRIKIVGGANFLENSKLYLERNHVGLNELKGKSSIYVFVEKNNYDDIVHRLISAFSNKPRMFIGVIIVTKDIYAIIASTDLLHEKICDEILLET